MEHSKSSDKSEYRVGLHSVRLQTAPTGRESVHLFFDFTIILPDKIGTKTPVRGISQSRYFTGQAIPELRLFDP